MDDWTGQNGRCKGHGKSRVLTEKFVFIVQTLENEAKEKDQTMKQLANALKAQQRAMEVGHPDVIPSTCYILHQCEGLYT